MTRVVYYVCGVSRCSILVSFFVPNPRVTCACTFGARGRKGQVGSHRYNRVRRERISGGSLTFPFVGSHDALGNRVIRFRPYAGWLAVPSFASRTLDLVSERITILLPLLYGLPANPPNKTGCFVLCRCYTWHSLTLQKGVVTTKAHAGAFRTRPCVVITVR